MSYILGIDSSSYQPSVAVVLDGIVCAQESSKDGFVGAESLLALVDKVFSKTGIGLLCISSIAVVVGPGSFTGIRSSISTAQGLGFGSNASLHGVSLFESMACFLRGKLEGRFRLVFTMRANKSELFCSIYDVTDGIFVEVLPCTVVKDEFVEVTIEEALSSKGRDVPTFRYDAQDSSWRLVKRIGHGDLIVSNAALAAIECSHELSSCGVFNESQMLPCRQLSPLYGKGVQAKTIVERAAI